MVHNFYYLFLMNMTIGIYLSNQDPGIMSTIEYL